MEDQRVNGAKNALGSMLFYYVYALKEAGYPDPKQEASEEVGRMISLADEQVQLVSEDAKLKGKLSENIGLALKLIEGMENGKEYDSESLRIIRDILLSVSESFNRQEEE